MPEMGTIYLLHLERPYRHARHYLGWTGRLDDRLAEHRAGHGSPLIAAAVRVGISFELATTWPGTRSDERRLHRYKNSPARLCPICRSAAGRSTLRPTEAIAAADRRPTSSLDRLVEQTLKA